MIDTMRFFQNPYKAINVVRKDSRTFKENRVVISCMSGSIGPVTITMFASPMIQPKIWRRFRSLMAAKAGCHLRPLPVPSRLVQLELFRIWRGVVLLLKQVVSGKRFVCGQLMSSH